MLDEFRHLRRAVATTWMTRKCMSTPMAAAMKVMVDPSPGPHDATDKIAATIIVTVLNRNDQSTMAVVVEGGSRRNTTPTATVEEVGHAQRITIKLAAMICGDRIRLLG